MVELGFTLLVANIAQQDSLTTLLGYASLLDWFLRGGPVMYPILVLSIAGVFFWLRGSLIVRKARKELPRGETLLRMANEKNFDSVLDAAHAGNGVIDRIAERLIPLSDSAPSELRREATEVMSTRLHSALGANRWLRTCARLAPLLGLLGTVLGISITFSRVAETGGTGDYAALADGIHQALFTTIFGLAVALVLTVLGALLTGRMVGLEHAGREYADRLIMAIKGGKRNG